MKTMKLKKKNRKRKNFTKLVLSNTNINHGFNDDGNRHK